MKQKQLFISFLVGSLVAAVSTLNYKKWKKNNTPKDVYVFRELPPKIIESVWTEIHRLKKDIGKNKGKWNDEHITRYAELRERLLSEEYVEYDNTHLHVKTPDVFPTKLEIKDWEKYITKTVKEIMVDSIPIHKSLSDMEKIICDITYNGWTLTVKPSSGSFYNITPLHDSYIGETIVVASTISEHSLLKNIYNALKKEQEIVLYKHFMQIRKVKI